MRSVVLAYHDMGYACLEELLGLGEEVPLVVTHQDQPGEEIWWRSVRELAVGRRIPVICPLDVNAPSVVDEIRAVEPDVLFSVMFRQLLRPALLEIPTRGAFNLHPSALPKFRGRASINWVLVKGESETGVTLHYMVEKPDRGDIVAQRRFPIDEEDTALTLHLRATAEARCLMREIHPLLRDGRAPRIPQDQEQASYFAGRHPEDGEIDWRWPARRIYNLIRAVTHPYPGAFTWHRGRALLIWWASPARPASALAPGKVRIEGRSRVLVGAGDRGVLVLRRVQPEGQSELDALEWATSSHIASGERLGRSA
jgi:methionyl-tRNA formyltransferase